MFFLGLLLGLPERTALEGLGKFSKNGYAAKHKPQGSIF